jgi:chemotaxis protein methyltransferase CheR
MHLSNSIFNKFVNLFYEKAGIKLGEHKKYLIVNRLDKLIGEERNYSNYEDYYDALTNDKSGELVKEFINRLTTNFSFFFREDVHFQFLEYFFQNKISGKKTIRIWSAACSTGEEPYSIALKAKTSIPNIDELDFKILATDISTRVLDIAMNGEYEFEKINRNNVLDKYLYCFHKYGNGIVMVKDDIKKLISFRYLNLLSTYPFKKKFDIVFLRNVLIYFENKEKEVILDKIYQELNPDGYLIMGLSESLVGVKNDFKAIKFSIYRK